MRGPDPYAFNEEIGLDIFTSQGRVRQAVPDPAYFVSWDLFSRWRIAGAIARRSELTTLPGDFAQELDWMGWTTSVHPRGSGNPQSWGIHAGNGAERMPFQVGSLGGTLPTWQGGETRRSIERNDEKGYQR